jgi:hypothetical protein
MSGTYIVHIFFTKPYSTRQQHEAGTYGDKPGISELEEGVGPIRAEQARALEPGENLIYAGNVWGAERQKVIIHKIE